MRQTNFVSATINRIVKCYSLDNSFNLFVVGTVIFNFILYICGVYFKSADPDEGGSDIRGDFFKLFLVWSNIFLMSGLLLQKKIGFSATWIKATFLTSITILNIGATLNLSLIIINSDRHEGDGKILHFNYDFLTLVLSMGTDVLYFALYVIFKSKRAVALTSFVIMAELFIFIFCVHLGTDFAIDVGNLTISMATTIIALPLWGAKVVLTPEGEPLEWKDFFEREDLLTIDITERDSLLDNGMAL